MEALTRPDNKWQIIDVTNITFYVTKLKDVALGGHLIYRITSSLTQDLSISLLKIIFGFFDVWPSLKEQELGAMKWLRNNYLMISVSIFKFLFNISKESIFLTFLY